MTAVQLLIGLATLVVNAFFVGAEFALISVRRSQIEPHAEDGDRRAKSVLWGLEHVSALMAAAQLGITLCTLVLGVVAEPAIAHLLEPVFHALGVPKGAGHAVSFVIALTLATYLHMLLGEMVPKNVALAEPVRTALLLGPPLVTLSRALRPVIFAINAFANTLLKLLRVETKDEVAATFSDAELARIVRDSGEAGLIDDRALERLHDALELGRRPVRDVVLPVERVVHARVDVTPEELERLSAESGFSASRWWTRGAASSATCTSRTRWTPLPGTCRSGCGTCGTSRAYGRTHRWTTCSRRCGAVVRTWRPRSATTAGWPDWSPWRTCCGSFSGSGREPSGAGTGPTDRRVWDRVTISFAMQTNPTHTSLVAVGDSFTEGMSDLLPDGSYRGWADLLAGRMAAVTPGFRYANLAVRGKLIGQIVDEQVDVAAAMRPDVITLVGGLNDTLRPKCDMGRVRGLLTEAVERLAPSCKQLVLMRSPGRQGPVLERFRPRMEELFTVVDELAAQHGAVVVDLYGPRRSATRACGTWTGCT